jgi:hypothetical protein
VNENGSESALVLVLALALVLVLENEKENAILNAIETVIENADESELE